MRELDFSDGFSSASTPNQGNVAANSLKNFVDDAAFVTDKGAAAAQGDIYSNTTLDRIRFHDGSQFVTIPDSANAQTIAGQWTFVQKILAKQGAGGGIDADVAGPLELGATTATEVKIGQTGITTKIMGDLQVEGNSTIVNTSTLDVEDANITVNNNGNDATAEGAGLEVERAGTNGSLKYQDSLSSKFKIGALGTEKEIITASDNQTLTNKTIDADLNTFSNIDDGNIKVGADIQRSKLLSGTANHVLINDPSGVMSSEAVLDESRGGTGNGSYAIGDLLVATAAAVLGRLAAGTNGYILTMLAGLPSWQPAAGGGGGDTYTDAIVNSETGGLYTSSIDGKKYIWL